LEQHRQLLYTLGVDIQTIVNVEKTNPDSIVEHVRPSGEKHGALSVGVQGMLLGLLSSSREMETLENSRSSRCFVDENIKNIRSTLDNGKRTYASDTIPIYHAQKRRRLGT